MRFQLDLRLLDHRIAHALVADLQRRRQPLAEPAQRWFAWPNIGYLSPVPIVTALTWAGAEIVTVAVRRVNVTDANQPLLMDYIDPTKITYLPNTAGCYTAEEAIREITEKSV